MSEYPKIHSLYKRDPANNNKTLLEGQFSRPEFEYLADMKWVWTEKVDGTNVRVLWDGEKIQFKGRTENAQIFTGLYDALNVLFNVDKMLKLFGGKEQDLTASTLGGATNVCLYGEGYGAKIQKGGGNYREDQGFALFDIRIGDWWLQRKDVEDIATKLGLEAVPIIGKGNLRSMVEAARAGFASKWGSFDAEGIVARPSVELLDRGGHRIITKIKYKDFTST